SVPAPSVGRKQIAIPWNAVPDRLIPRLPVFSEVNGECIREKDRSSRVSVFHRACCYPSYFCQTSPGNPRRLALLRPSARRNHREKCGEIANDGTVRHLRAPVVLSRQRIG